MGINKCYLILSWVLSLGGGRQMFKLLAPDTGFSLNLRHLMYPCLWSLPLTRCQNLLLMWERGWEVSGTRQTSLAMKIRRTRLQNIIIGLLCLLGRWLLMDRLFLYLGICIWIWASKHSATWHVSGYIPMHCVSRQEAGNIMMVPVISVACRQFKMKNTLFSCVLACKCVRRGFNSQTCFTIYLCHTKLLSIRLELFISPKLVLRMSSIFSRNKLMIPFI